MVTVRPHGVTDQATARALDELAKAAVGPGLLTGAVLMEDVNLSADTVVRVKHNLGRRAKGYLITGRRNIAVAAVTRLMSGSAFYPYIEATNWDPPGGSQNYWSTLKTNRTLHLPLPVAVGETLTGISLTTYNAAAADMTFDTYYSAYNDASASAFSPTVTWSSQPTTTWSKIAATFDQLIAADTDYYLRIVGPTIGDRIRMAHVSVKPTTMPVVIDENDQHGDLDKFLYLKSVGGSMTVDLAVF